MNAELTPAQQHADELVEMLWIVANRVRAAGGDDTDARALLDKIQPPEPSTLLPEALEVLEAITNGPGISVDDLGRARVLLNRARRVGLLK